MGTGTSSGNWKAQLRKMAKQGKMPRIIYGDRATQSAVLKEIDRLYDMPEVNAKIVDQGNAVWVNFYGTVSRSLYPSGNNASEEEKRGALKMLLYNHK